MVEIERRPDLHKSKRSFDKKKLHISNFPAPRMKMKLFLSHNDHQSRMIFLYSPHIKKKRAISNTNDGEASTRHTIHNLLHKNIRETHCKHYISVKPPFHWIIRFPHIRFCHTSRTIINSSVPLILTHWRVIVNNSSLKICNHIPNLLLKPSTTDGAFLSLVSSNKEHL